MINQEPDEINQTETDNQHLKETQQHSDQSIRKSSSNSYLSSSTATPFCDSPTNQFTFTSSQLLTQTQITKNNLHYKSHSPPTRTYTGTSSIPSVSITPSLFDDSPQPSTPPTLYDDPISSTDLTSPTAHHFSSSFSKPTHSSSSSCSSTTKSSSNQIPLQLPPSPFINHRRHSSQPSTPIPVKETFNGMISSYGTEEGQRKLNQYLLLKTIGRGSYGSVELAQDLTSPQGKLYAIKEYSKSRMRKRARVLDSRAGGLRARRPPNILLGSNSNVNPVKLPVRSMSDGMGLVKAEVAIMKKLAHPNIASLIEVIDTDTDSLFFVLELCPYGSVMPMEIGQESKKLNPIESRNIFRQLILGIEYLHFNEILHRDIKPDNILFVEDPKSTNEPLCKIVDFGVSENFGKAGDDTTQKLAGSPAFIPPELCASTGGTRGKPADIWAMGVTLYTLVVGKLPFEDTNQLALCEKIMNDPIVIPEGTDPDLEDLLQKLLNKSPELRIEMQDLKEHPWVTDHSKYPLPTTSENVTPVNPPTELEIAYAFKSLRSLSTIVKAVTRLKARYRSRRTLSHNDMSPQKEEGPSTRKDEEKEEGEQKGKEKVGKEEDGDEKEEICLSPNSLVIELDPTPLPSSPALLSPPPPPPPQSSIGFEGSFETSLNLNQ